MSKLNVLFTIDYEMYFDDNVFSPNKVLFNPSQKLIDAFYKEKIPISIFADVLSYTKHKEFGLYDYCLSFRDQLQDAYSKNCDIALHIHSHWINSTFNGSWKFDNANYSLQNFIKKDYDLAFKIVKNSINELKEIVKNENYFPVAYRAGGYSINDFEKEHIEILASNGIKIDSSVYPNLYVDNDFYKVDFRNKNFKNSYLILDSFCKEDSNGKILELPLLSVKKSEISFFYKVLNKINLLLFAKRDFQKRGSSIHISGISKSEYGISFDFNVKADNFMHLKLFDKYIKSFNNLNEVFIVINSHPKAMFDSSIDTALDFFKKIRRRYKDINFLTMKDLV